MARKTLPATRKRTSPARLDQEGGDHEQQQQQQQQQQTDQTMAVDVPPSTQGKKQRPNEDLPNLRKCKKDDSLLLGQVKELCRALKILGSLQSGNAITAAYGSGHNLVSGAGEPTRIPDLMGTLSNLRPWMDNMAVRANADHSLGHFIEYTNLINAISRKDSCDDLLFDDALRVFMYVCSQCGVVETLLSQLERRSKTCMRLFGREPTLGSLLDGLFHRQGPTRKRRNACLDDMPAKAAKLIFSNERTHSIKSNKHDIPQLQSVPCLSGKKHTDVASRNPQKKTLGQLESWIVKHSTRSSEEGEDKESSKSMIRTYKDKYVSTYLGMEPIETPEDDFVEPGKDRQIEFEVVLSAQKRDSSLEINGLAAETLSNIPYLKNIQQAVSLSKARLNGQSEVMVLFKALRSDQREVIVDNSYLRSTYPLLLVDFYEQNLHVLNGKQFS